VSAATISLYLSLLHDIKGKWSQSADNKTFKNKSASYLPAVYGAAYMRLTQQLE